MRMVGRSSPVIEYVVRPHIQILCIVASFLGTAEGETLLGKHLDPATARERIVRGIRWACETHLTGTRDVDELLSRKRWGQNWRSSLWASQLALCASLCKSFLPPELFEAVCVLVAAEADRFIDTIPPTGCQVDTKAEENAHDTMVIAWALNTCPQHANVARWERALRLWAMNIATTLDDRYDHSECADRSVAYWVTTQTFHPDMTVENHGFFNPELLSYSQWIVLAMAAYTLNGREPPSCLASGHHKEAFDLMLRFCLPNGMFVAPGGHDLPLFLPRPFAFAWGLWHGDPRAFHLTDRLLAWMQTWCVQHDTHHGPWVHGLESGNSGWVLLFQSMVGFELSLLAILPERTPRTHLYSPGYIENAVDTRRIHPYVEVCYRRNTRSTRSVAWRALADHPIIGLITHDMPELLVPGKAALLGIPAAEKPVRAWEVLYHNDRLRRDGFDSAGRVRYYDEEGEGIFTRDVRVVTWGDDGLMICDEIVAMQQVTIPEQMLMPVYLVNDHWTGKGLHLSSGSLQETFASGLSRGRPVSCPTYWASIEQVLLLQLVWGRRKGLTYQPSFGRNAPPYWHNCRLDSIGVHVDFHEASAGQTIHKVCLYLGGGKSPRPLKCSGEPGPFFRGLVIMDGKNTLGLD